MSTETTDETNETPAPTPDTTIPAPPVDEVEKKIQDALQPIKSNLDKAYAERDAAIKKAAEYEQKEKEAELKRLQDDGKYKEAYELQLAEANAKVDVLVKRNLELARDAEIKSALSSYVFRSDKALDMAYMDIASQLVQNELGVWTHKSGTELRTFIKQFSESEDNSFLFKPKVSTGGGTSGAHSTAPSDNANKSLFKLSQEEVLKRAAEGTLRR
jgi:hypothetical protein